MDTSISGALSSTQQLSTHQQVSNKVLRTSLDTQEQSAKQLIDSVADANNQQSESATSSAGTKLNVFA